MELYKGISSRTYTSNEHNTNTMRPVTENLDEASALADSVLH